MASFLDDLVADLSIQQVISLVSAIGPDQLAVLSQVEQKVPAPGSYDELSYDSYLRTEHWKEMALLCKERDKGKCVICDSKDNLAAHHKRYIDKDGKSILGHETLGDLITLCNTCHLNVHCNKHLEFPREHRGKLELSGTALWEWEMNVYNPLHDPEKSRDTVIAPPEDLPEVKKHKQEPDDAPPAGWDYLSEFTVPA